MEPQSSSSRNRQPTVFGGTGYRLGETSEDSQGNCRICIEPGCPWVLVLVSKTHYFTS